MLSLNHSSFCIVLVPVKPKSLAKEWESFTLDCCCFFLRCCCYFCWCWCNTCCNLFSLIQQVVLMIIIAFPANAYSWALVKQHKQKTNTCHTVVITGANSKLAKLFSLSLALLDDCSLFLIFCDDETQRKRDESNFVVYLLFIIFSFLPSCRLSTFSSTCIYFSLEFYF